MSRENGYGEGGGDRTIERHIGSGRSNAGGAHLAVGTKCYNCVSIVSRSVSTPQTQNEAFADCTQDCHILVIGTL